jgi:hypothetical protein
VGCAYTLILPTSRAAFTVADDGQSEYTVTLAASALEAIDVETEAQLVGRATGSGDYDGESHVFYRGGVTILPNPEQSTGDGMRSAAEIELAALNTAILALTEGRITSYSIAGRAVQYNDLPKMYQRQAVLESKVRAEQGRGFRQRKVAFVRAG